MKTVKFDGKEVPIFSVNSRFSVASDATHTHLTIFIFAFFALLEYSVFVTHLLYEERIMGRFDRVICGGEWFMTLIQFFC